MTPELTYFIKVNLALVLLYGFYRLFFYKDTYFTMRRIVLLLFFALAFSYPLFNIQDWMKMQVQEPIVGVFYSGYSAMLPEIEVQATETVSWTQILKQAVLFLYLTVSGFLFLRFLVQLGSIWRIARQSKRAIINGVSVYLLSKPASPFSFFRMIFIYPSSHSENELEEILTHESTHVSQWHSIDVILCELVAVVCWINPFVWLLKREIKHNLEYLADNTVIHAGYDSKAYQFHLLGLTHYQTTTSLYNNFNVLDIKNRIIMMNKKRSGRIGRAKYFVFLPFAALLLQFCNINRADKGSNDAAGTGVVNVEGKVVDVDGQSIIGATVVVKGGDTGTITDLDGNFVLEAEKNATLSIAFVNYTTVERSVSSVLADPKIVLGASTQKHSGEQVFTVVEEMPKFPGGDEALLTYINTQIKYPQIAKDNGIQGRVIVTFTVNKDGTISDSEVVRGVDPSLDTEALRVIESFPLWTPGKQRGNPVRVKYTVPITFSLGGSLAESTRGGKDVEVKPTPSKHGDVYTVVEEMPRFPGGDQALLKYINQNIKYPVDAQEKGLQGRVIASFIVLKDGKITDINVVRGVAPSLDEESVRVIASMPLWTPGKEGGKPVNVKYTVPITFRLQ